MTHAQKFVVIAAGVTLGACGTFADDQLREPRFTTPAMTPYGVVGDSVAGEPSTSATLWRSGPESLFGDRRARAVGDIVTIVVEIDDEAEIRNRTERQRDASESVSAPALLGVNTLAQRILPGGAGLDPAIDASSSSESNGEGAIRRRERITLRVAATVTQVLPNGGLAVYGSQEVRVNEELRDLRVEGVVRREDISRANVVTYDRIAEARISYGGRGDVTRVNRTRYGQKILDIISPF